MLGNQISEISVNFHPAPAKVFNQAKNISARGAYELSNQSLRQIGHTNKPRLLLNISDIHTFKGCIYEFLN